MFAKETEELYETLSTQSKSLRYTLRVIGNYKKSVDYLNEQFEAYVRNSKIEIEILQFKEKFVK